MPECGLDLDLQSDNMRYMKRSIRYDRAIIDSLRSMAIFVRVVENRSFRRAAEQLALSPSVVSHHINQLEEQLGKPLLVRTTRSISMTSDGAIFLAAANEMLKAASSAFDQVSSDSQSIAGELQIAISTVLSRSQFLRQISEFESKFPNLTLSLSFGDDVNKSLAEGYDLALSVGRESSNNTYHRRLALIERRVVGSPAYFNSNKLPENLNEIADCEWIWQSRSKSQLLFQKNNSDEKPQKVTISPRIFVDNMMACRRLSIEGIGLSLVPAFAVEEDITSRRLIWVMPDYRPEPVALTALWPKTSTKELLTHLFIEFVAGSFDSPS